MNPTIVSAGPAEVDFLTGGTQGSIAKRLLKANMDVNVLRTNATLLDREWIEIDKAVVQVQQNRLKGVADLKARGLVWDLNGRGMGIPVIQYQDESDVTPAMLSMTAGERGRNDRPDYGLKFFPLPIVHKPFQFDIRTLTASRNSSMPLDVRMAALASRKVNELIEDILFNGYGTFEYGGGNLYGYTNFPYRNTVVMAKDWATSATGAEIVKDVQAMMQASIDDRHYGPWVLYVPTNYQIPFGNDYAPGTSNAITLRKRLMELEGLDDIVVADHLAAGHVVLVEMNVETVRMITGLPLTNVEWSEEGDMLFNFRVMTIDVPQLRADYDGRCGIVHLASAANT